MPRPKSSNPAPPGPPQARRIVLQKIPRAVNLRARPKRPYKPLTVRQQLMAHARRLRYKQLHPFRPPRLLTAHDLLRAAYVQAGVPELFHYLRTHDTNVERLLVNNGYDRKLAKFLNWRDALLLTAAETGLKPGHIALTLPERLVIQWMESKGYQFGGVYPNVTNNFADFYSQYPIGGGRSAFGGGLVADIFISDRASRTQKGIVLAVDGQYYHSKQAVSGRDAAQNTLVQSMGYQVARITDTQIYAHGVLDNFMSSLLGNH